MQSVRVKTKMADRGIQSVRRGRHRIRPYSYRSAFLALLCLLGTWTCSGQTNVLTYHNDVARTGQNLDETLLTPANVNSTNFGKLGFMSVDGLVDGEPLYLSNLTVAGASHNVVFVVTESDSVYAFDANSFSQLWHVSVLPSGETPSDNRGCGQVTPQIGITSTPVIDPLSGAHGTIFLVAMSKDSNGNYHQRLHALDITTGAEQSGSPTTIAATYTYPATGGHTTFDPAQYKERTGLLLLKGTIYLAWASHCDNTPFQGWIMGYNESTLRQVSVLNLTPNGTDGAIWMSGGGLAADAADNIYFLDANGTFDDTLNPSGFPINGDYGNSFLKLSTSGNSLSVADYFTMNNTDAESSIDEDLGSGGMLLLPDLTDNSGNTWHLAVGAGKDANIYVVDRDLMGKLNTNNNGIYQLIQGALANGVWAAPAYFNNSIYYGAVADNLKEFSISSARVSSSATSKSAGAFAYPGTTPSISSNGTLTGIVWAGNSNGAGVLHAYNAANLATELYNSNQAANGRDQFSDNKFITPMIANGKVFVGTPTGVAVFGLLAGGTETTASPTFSPTEGTISPVQQITILDATSGATIYYTVNGTTPSATSSEQYTGPFTLSASTTVEAVAVAGSSTSSVASTRFTVLPPAPVPSINPAGGTITFLQAITITDTALGAAIYYTTDGTTPTLGGGTTKQYSGPFTITASATVKAIAEASGFSSSNVSSAALTVQSSLMQGATISIDFVGLGTTPMASSEFAGVVALSNWNDAAGASSTSPLALVDLSGNPTTATATWVSDDVWDQPITDQPGNARMMKGYLDNGKMDTTTVTVSGLPTNANGYTVYVYAQGASSNSSNTGIYQISGTGITTTSATLTYNSNFNGTFTQATASNLVGNYVVLIMDSECAEFHAVGDSEHGLQPKQARSCQRNPDCAQFGLFRVGHTIDPDGECRWKHDVHSESRRHKCVHRLGQP